MPKPSGAHCGANRARASGLSNSPRQQMVMGLATLHVELVIPATKIEGRDDLPLLRKKDMFASRARS